MKIEITLNKLEDDWWFDIGLSYQKTEYHKEYNNVFTIALLFFSIYIRFNKKL